ncbi:MAG: phosphatase PAP2 family protein [Chloroflexi bacterium]|nr:phosphatase PAP2 family protein [Chloroflexota bacterium]
MNWFDDRIILGLTGAVGKSNILDRIMILLATDYFIPVVIALMLLSLWYMGRDSVERERNQRALMIAATAMGSACGFVLALNHLWPGRNHPFEDMPQLMLVVNQIAYPIKDPTFPSNTAAVTFAAPAAVWQWNRKMGLLLLIPGILMPLAKMYAGLYYFTDILAGAAVGIATGYFISKVAMPWFEPIISRLLKALRKLCIA